MRTISLTCFILALSSIKAQYFDAASQYDLVSYYSDAHLLPNGNYLCLDLRYENYVPSGTENYLVTYDQTGTVVEEVGLTTDPNDVGFITGLEVLSNGDLLLIGAETAPCDVGYPRPQVRRYDGNQVLWQNTFGPYGPYYHLYNDSLLIMVSYDSLLTIDHNGQMVTSSALPQVLGPRRLSRSDNGFYRASFDGLFRYNMIGVLLDSLANTNTQYALELDPNNTFCVTGDSILLLDGTLQRTGLGRSLPTGTFVDLIEVNSNYLLVMSDTLIEMDLTLSNISISSIDAPDGWRTNSVLQHDSSLVLIGSRQTVDAWASAIRSFSLNGATTMLDKDIALHTVEADSFNYHVGYPPGANLSIVNGDVWVKVWVTNTGSSAIDQLTLNGYLPYGFCEVVATTYHFDSLALQPGDSVQLSAGHFDYYAEVPSTIPTNVQFCVFISSPDGRVEANVTDNRACGTVLVPLGLEEHRRVGFSLHPNPTNDVLSIVFSELTASTDLVIHDASGRRVMDVPIINGSLSTQISVGELQPGLYFLSVNTGARAITRKLLVE